MTSTTEGLTGRVVRPGDDDYPTARAGWNLLFDHRPMAIVFARETGDVVTALAWARRNQVAVRVRSGGHCLEGWNSVDDGIVIDVSEMKFAVVDAAAGTATVGAGLNQLEAVTTLGAAGVAAPTGTEGTVGLVGATLGGGFGLLTRAFGMASDNLLAAEVVVASGVDGAEAITVSEDDHADLLWALRGAGNGNFGVVTSLTYRVHPLRQVVYVTASWPGLTHLREVFHAWQRSAPFADERMTSQLEISQGEIQLIAVLAGGSEADAARVLEPVLAVGDPTVSMLDGNWADVYGGFQVPNDDEAANWKFHSHFVSQPLPDEAVDLIGSFLAAAPMPGCNYFANAFGGAVTRTEPAGGSAFAHRGALFYAEPGAGWGERGGRKPDEALTARCVQWTADFAEALAPFADGAYVNVPNADDPDFATAYWGANVPRLREVKATYDPHRVFRYEQGITPPG
ncbi:FAD-binding oxidoreductase [Mycobacterium sp. AT1]|uniref:FAD-binding oxidoreductase n=1 Tax=Mycobacterium sp. AT1 TaxID=1961706 RepID=UPI0009AD2D6D|nr:FAD-binding oxidoreductase [Mycobacterium sp. AT1]OPX08541.1 FAD-binding protein [Mycobacterium sp. AT1]